MLYDLKTSTLNDMYEKALDLKTLKADIRQPAHDFTFLNDGTLTAKPAENALFAASMTPAPFTEWAMNQTYGKLGKAYTGRNGKNLNSLKSDHIEALRTVDPELWATVMNAAVTRLPADESWFARTYDGKVRAMLSGKDYLEIDNHTIIEWLLDILNKDKSIETRLSKYSFVNVDNMNIDVMFSDIQTGRGGGTGGDMWTIGVRIRNGEIGDWQGGCFAVARKHKCDNSISVDREGFSYKFRHAGHKTLELKKHMMKVTMLTLIPMAEKLAEAVIAADEKELPSFADVVGGLKYKHGWSDEFTGAVFAGSEGRETVGGLVDGLTYAAHVKPTSPEHQVETEFFAGKVLFDVSGGILNEARHLYHSKEARKAYAEAK